MELIWHLLHLWYAECGLDLAFKITHLLLHLVNLLLKLRVVLPHQFDGISGFRLVWGSDLVLERLVVFDFVAGGTSSHDLLIDFILIVLLLKEVADKCKHLADVVIGAAKVRVLFDGHFEHLYLITQLGHVIGKLLRPFAILNHEPVDEECLLDGDLVAVLKWLSILVVQAVELEA